MRRNSGTQGKYVLAWRRERGFPLDPPEPGPRKTRCALESRDRRNMARTSELFVTCLLFILSSGAERERERERVYHVGIIEESWDYAPSRKNLLNGEDLENDE